MTKNAGLDHEYDLLGEAKSELVRVIWNPPADPEQWSTEFGDRFRSLITTPAWMRTGLVLPDEIIPATMQPTLASLINVARTGMGLQELK